MYACTYVCVLRVIYFKRIKLFSYFSLKEVKFPNEILVILLRHLLLFLWQIYERFLDIKDWKTIVEWPYCRFLWNFFGFLVPRTHYVWNHVGATLAFIPSRAYSNLQLYSICPYRPFKSVYSIQPQLMHDNCKMHRIPRPRT